MCTYPIQNPKYHLSFPIRLLQATFHMAVTPDERKIREKNGGNIEKKSMKTKKKQKGKPPSSTPPPLRLNPYLSILLPDHLYHPQGTFFSLILSSASPTAHRHHLKLH